LGLHNKINWDYQILQTYFTWGFIEVAGLKRVVLYDKFTDTDELCAGLKGHNVIGFLFQLIYFFRPIYGPVFVGAKGQLARKADNPTPICEPIV
jgi:hypothetical protein